MEIQPTSVIRYPASSGFSRPNATLRSERNHNLVRRGRDPFGQRRGSGQKGPLGTRLEKPLPATVCFSIEKACPRDAYDKTLNVQMASLPLVSQETLGTYIQRQDAKENVIKTKVLILSKTTTLHVHHAFLCISLPFLHDYHVKIPNFAFYG